MPDFTMRLDQVMELENYAERGPEVIGLATYPIFDENYRAVLNEKIIRRYLMQEIGHETISLFRHAMNREMHEIMPLFNQLYLSEKLNIDPLNTVNLRTLATSEFTNKTESTTTAESNGQVSSDSTATGGGSAEALAMDYPQQQLNSNGRYATSGTKSENNSESSNVASEDSSQQSEQSATATGDGDATSDTTQTGWSGSQAELLARFRETFLNIDLDVINSLQPLFMGIVGTGGAEYRDPGYSWWGGGPYRYM